MQEFRFADSAVVPLTPDRVLRVLTYEVGRLNELLHKQEVYGKQGFVGDMKCESADVLAMLLYWFELHGWSFDEMRDLAVKRYTERQDDLRVYSRGAVGTRLEYLRKLLLGREE